MLDSSEAIMIARKYKLTLLPPVRSVLIATLGLAAVLAAGCTTTRISTATDAQRLERSADAFVVDTCNEPNTSCVPAAQAFADQAQAFDRTLRGGAGDQEVVLAYKRLWHSYHTLRNDVYRSRDREARADLKPVTRAFNGVELLVKNGYSDADPTLLSSGGYTLDPYYN